MYHYIQGLVNVEVLCSKKFKHALSSVELASLAFW
jgi:hypothetical protein